MRSCLREPSRSRAGAVFSDLSEDRFLTTGLYGASMASDPRGGITQSGSSGSFTYAVRLNMGNKPVNFVTVFDAMRLHPASRD